MADKRETFTNTAMSVMAMVGSAVGLGNIWRFPYLTGQCGGGAFIVIYLIASIFMALPIFFAESIIGRHTQSNTYGAIDKIAPGTKWKYVSILTIIAPLIILSFYSVVGGWSVDFLVKSVVSGFSESDAGLFGTFASSVWGPLFFHTIFLSTTALIVNAGVKSGIEKFNKICLPILFFLIVTIMIFSLRLEGASKGVEYMLKPDFSKVDIKTVACAIGQSFFSLSLGVGAVLTYSSYMKKESNIVTSGFRTAFFDLFFALLAGFAVMPAVFAAGIEPSSGPGLIFDTLPFIFAKLGVASPFISRIISILFFITIVMAALTSSISTLEVGAAYLTEEKKMSRGKAVFAIFLGTWILGILCSLSFGPLSGFKIGGLILFDFCDLLTSNVLMILGGLLFVIIVGWKMKKKDVYEELCSGSNLRFNRVLADIIYFFIRYFSPITLLIIFVSNILWG